MSIPRGLIFYKATRHKENFPVDIKYGCYSDEISSSLHATSKNKPYANFHRRYQKKLVQEISFNFFDDIPKEKGALRVFSSFSGIKKCTIDSALFSLPHHSKKLMLKILQKLFKSFKRIKQLKLGSLGPLNNDSKSFKNLLLLNQLESLVLLNFEYKADSKNLQLLLKVAQKASKRRLWLNFKSFRVLPFCSGVSFASSADEIVQALQNLFEFIQSLKLCENIYKCSSFQITLPNCSLINSKQAEILSKISRISPSLTRIKVHQLKHFSNFFKMCQNSRDLKAISFRIAGDRKEQNTDLSFLEKITTLEELELRLENKGGGLFQHILPQIQRLTDLTVLSLDFFGKLGELKCGLVQVISGLSELKDLKLKFTENVEKTDPNYVQFSLEDIFGAVSVKRKLEKLYLYFWDFGFDNSSKKFEVMCQSLEKLTSLTNFDLEIMKGSTIEKKEILLFCEVLRKLNRIQYFHLQIEGSLAFKSRIFGMLFDCIAESLPFLSSFGLALSSVEITRESFPTLSNAMKKMKCLNEVRILLGGCAETGVDIDILAGEIKKRAPADIYTYFT